MRWFIIIVMLVATIIMPNPVTPGIAVLMWLFGSDHITDVGA